jgi:hypothetical protein
MYNKNIGYAMINFFDFISKLFTNIPAELQVDQKMKIKLEIIPKCP